VCFDLQSPTVADRGVVLPARDFNLGSVEQISREFFSEMAPRMKLARLTIGTSEDTINRTWLHGTPYDNSYESTKEEVRRLHLPALPVARLIIVDKSGLLSFRDTKGLTERLIAGTKDPTRLRALGTTFQLLHLQLTKPGPALKPPCYSLVVYLKASPTVSITACLAVLEQIRKLTVACHLDIVVRPDTWFLEDFYFPALFPFQRDLAMPNKAQFTLAPRVSCGFTERTGVHCAGRSFRP
jgi:hypothetical protein